MEVDTKEKKSFTQITLDRATIARFRKVAEDEPLASYLRKLSVDLSGEREQLDAVRQEKLASLFEQTKSTVVMLPGGGIDEEKSERGMGLIDYSMIQQAIQEDPMIVKVGWYSYIDNKWVLDHKSHNTWFDEYNTLRDQGLTDREAGYITNKHQCPQERRIGLANVEYYALRDKGFSDQEASDKLSKRKKDKRNN